MVEKDFNSNRKGQMKIQQMAFMLIAVTLFFVLVGMFVLVFVYSGLKDSAQALDEQNALLLASKLAESPEFSCGRAFGTTQSNCIDRDKVLALKENLNSYSQFWGVSGLEIRTLYPGSEIIEIVQGNTGTGVSNFVSLCYKEKEEVSGRIYDKCELAKLIVSYGGEDAL